MHIRYRHHMAIYDINHPIPSTSYRHQMSKYNINIWRPGHTRHYTSYLDTSLHYPLAVGKMIILIVILKSDPHRP